MRFAAISFISIVALATPGVSESAGSHDVSATWRLVRQLAGSRVALDDLPDHSFVLAKFLLVPSDGATVGSWRMQEASCTEVVDSLRRGGFPVGYCTITFSSKDRLFLKYRGELQEDTDAAPGTTRRIDGSGSLELLGGTGAFERASGKGTWESSGEENEDGLRERWIWQIRATVAGVEER